MFQSLTNLISFSWQWIVINSILFGLIYHFVIKYWSFFSDRDVKFIRGIPFFGSSYKIFMGLDSVSDVFEDVYNRYRDESFIGIYDFGGSPVYVIRDPQMIKQIGIKDFDHFVNHRNAVSEESDSLLGRSMFIMKNQKWKDMRSTLSPAFTGSKMRLMLDLVTECADEFCDFLKKEVKDKTVVYDSKDLLKRFASDTISTCAFGMKVNSLENRENDFYKTGLTITNFEGLNSIKMFAYSSLPKLMNFFKVKFFTDKDASYLRDMVHSNMNYREQNNIFRPDMINLLMEAKTGALQHEKITERDDVGFATVQESDIGKSSRKLQKWEDDDFTAQCMLFFLAGFNAVAGGHCFMAHELAVNPHIQEKLYQEIRDVCNQLNGKRLTYDVLQKMPYMDMVVSETLRRWNIAPIIDRIVTKPYELKCKNGNKVQLNVGDGVLLPLVGIHMDPQYYPNPKDFDPERFSEENKHKIRPETYLPFGLGPRNCIGSRFALMQMKSLFFYLLKNFIIERSLKTQHPLKLKKNTFTVEGENGFWIQLKSR